MRLIFRHPFHDKVVNATDYCKDGKCDEEAKYSGVNVCHFHVACACYALTYFYGKGDDDDNSKYVDPCDYHRMIGICKPFEYRIYDENQEYSQNADDDKMQFLITKTVFSAIV